LPNIVFTDLEFEVLLYTVFTATEWLLHLGYVWVKSAP